MAAQISVPAENIVSIGSFSMSNSVLGSFLVTGLLLLVILYIRRGVGLVPSRIQIILEIIVEYFKNTLVSAFGDEKKARTFLPFFLSLFIFLLIANQFSILPFLTNIISDGKPFLRTPTSDWSQTITPAIVIIVMAHVIAFATSPLRHLGNYIKIGPFIRTRSLKDFGNALFELFLGVMDIIGEIAKIVSLSARLFGNVFAGEVMVVVITSLSIYTSFIVPVPFMVISIFSGLVQAFVFTLLSMQFMAGTIRAVATEQTT